jgi:hypothetical protein
MTELTAAQKQNADNILGATAQVHSSIWTGVSAYLQKIGLPNVHWTVNAGQMVVQHTINNIAINEFSVNPNKYIMENSFGAVGGLAGMWAGAKGGAWIGSAVGLTIPGAVAGAVIGAVAGDEAFQEMFEHAYNNWPALRNWVNNFDPSSPSTYIPPEVQKYFNDVVVEAAEAINKHAKELQESLNKTAEDISNAMKKVWEDTVKGLSDAYDFVKSSLTSLLNNVGNFINEVWEGISEWMTTLLDEAGEISEDIVDAIKNMWDHPSPIDLDINKSGKIETTSLTASKTYFDIDNQKIDWVANDNLIIDGKLIFCKISA